MICQQIKIIKGDYLLGEGGTEESLNLFLEGIPPSNFMFATVEVSQIDSDSKVFCYYRKDTDNFPVVVSMGDYFRPQIKVFAEGVGDGSEFATFTLPLVLIYDHVPVVKQSFLLGLVV